MKTVKCKQCGQKDGVHKMGCESRRQTVILPKFENEDDKKHWGYGEEALFKMLNNIANGKLKK